MKLYNSNKCLIIKERMNEFNSIGRHTDKKYEKDTQIEKEREQKDR